MKSVRAAAIVILVGIGVALMGVPADAQQATALSTPTVPNPNWCPGVPLSPPPQVREPDVWNREWQRCMNSPGVAEDYNCGHLCKGAREMLWRASDASIPEKPPQHWTAEGKTQGQWTALRAHCVALFGEISSAGYNKPLPPFSPSDWENCHEITVPPAPAPTWPAPTDKVQGPFRLKNGAWKFILPQGTAPKTPAAESTVSPLGLANPPGPFLHFAGADLSATTQTPLDVAAEASSIQNVEFVNGVSLLNGLYVGSANGGFYVYDKTGIQKKHTDTARCAAARTESVKQKSALRSNFSCARNRSS